MDKEIQEMNSFHALTEAYLALLKMPHGALRARQQSVLAALRDAIAAESGCTAEEVQNEFEHIALMQRKVAA